MNGMTTTVLALLYRALRGGIPAEASTSTGTATLTPDSGSVVTQAIRSALAKLHAEANAEAEKNRRDRDRLAYMGARRVEFVRGVLHPNDVSDADRTDASRSSEVIASRRLRAGEINLDGVRAFSRRFGYDPDEFVAKVTARAAVEVTTSSEPAHAHATTSGGSSTHPQVSPEAEVRRKLGLNPMEWGKLLAFVQTVHLPGEVLRLVEKGVVDAPLRNAVLETVGVDDSGTNLDLRLAAVIWTWHHGRSCPGCHTGASAPLHTCLTYARTHGLQGWQQLMQTEELGGSLKAATAATIDTTQASHSVCSWCQRSDLLVAVNLLSGEFPVTEQVCSAEAALLRRAHLRVARPELKPSLATIEAAIRGGKYPLPLNVRKAISGLHDVVGAEMGLTGGGAVRREPVCAHCGSSDGVHLYVVQEREAAQLICCDHAYLLASKGRGTITMVPKDEFIRLVRERKLVGMSKEGKAVELFDGRWKPSGDPIPTAPERERVVVESTPVVTGPVTTPTHATWRDGRRDDQNHGGEKDAPSCPRCNSLDRQVRDDFRIWCNVRGNLFEGQLICALCADELHPEICDRHGCSKHRWTEYEVTGIGWICGYCHRDLKEGGYNLPTGKFDGAVTRRPPREWVTRFIQRGANGGTLQDLVVKFNSHRPDRVPNDNNGAKKEVKAPETTTDHEEQEQEVHSSPRFKCFGCKNLFQPSDLTIVRVRLNGALYHALYDGQCQKSAGMIVESVRSSAAEEVDFARALHQAFVRGDQKILGNQGLLINETVIVPPAIADSAEPEQKKTAIPTRGPDGSKLSKAQRKAAAKRIRNEEDPFPTAHGARVEGGDPIPTPPDEPVEPIVKSEPAPAPSNLVVEAEEEVPADPAAELSQPEQSELEKIACKGCHAEYPLEDLSDGGLCAVCQVAEAMEAEREARQAATSMGKLDVRTERRLEKARRRK